MLYQAFWTPNSSFVTLRSRSVPLVTAVMFSGLDGVNAHDLLLGFAGLVGVVGLVGLVGPVGVVGGAGLVGLTGLVGPVGLVGLAGVGLARPGPSPHQSATSFGYCSSGRGQRCPGGKLAPALSRSQGTYTCLPLGVLVKHFVGGSASAWAGTMIATAKAASTPIARR